MFWNENINVLFKSHRIGFASILRQLCKAKEKGQKSCDKFAMNMRRSIQNAESLSRFYQSFNTAPDYDQAKALAKPEKKARDYLKASLIPFFLSDYFLWWKIKNDGISEFNIFTIFYMDLF